MEEEVRDADGVERSRLARARPVEVVVGERTGVDLAVERHLLGALEAAERVGLRGPVEVAAGAGESGVAVLRPLVVGEDGLDHRARVV